MGGAVHQEDEAGTPPALVAPAVVVKGKRSKRQRVHAPPMVLTAPAELSSSAASATATAAAPGEEDSGSTSRSADEAASTEEEEDMALCLMLLSRGEPAAVKEARFRSRRPANNGGAAGEFVYECKTCNKCFPSFQALGGHRTSHKKPRLQLPPAEADKNPPPAATVETSPPSPALPPSPAQDQSTNTDATVLAIPVPVVVPKQEPAVAMVIAAAATSSSISKHPNRVHECSICGAEFASGQALGGHMRRHRPLVPARDVVDAAPKKEKSLLELDLNMPAPCDEPNADTSPRFAFTELRPPLLFPEAASIVGLG